MSNRNQAGDTRIGSGTVIRGSIRGSGDVEIDGRVEGIVDVAGDLSLGSSARVRIESGALKGSRVTVRGALAGNVEGEVAVVLEEGARVVGDLSAPSIGIRPGGLLRGYVSTEGSDSEAPTKNRRELARPVVAPKAVVAPKPVATRSPATQRNAPAPRPQREPEEKAVEVTPTKRQEAPAPVMPSIKKGAKGQMKRKAGGR